jgi:hypothetical protein
MTILGFHPKPLTLDQLLAIVNPEKAKQPEVVPAVLYSSRNFPAAGTNALTFFDTNQADPTTDDVSNNQLPSPQFFQLQEAGINFLGIISNNVAGPASMPNDIALIINTQRALFRLSISSKEYLRVPVRDMGQLGGLNAFFAATTAAGSITGFGTNGLPGLGGFKCNGMIVIPPQTDFTARIDLAASQAINAAMHVAVELYGPLYRRVL